MSIGGFPAGMRSGLLAFENIWVLQVLLLTVDTPFRRYPRIWAAAAPTAPQFAGVTLNGRTIIIGTGSLSWVLGTRQALCPESPFI